MEAKIASSRKVGFLEENTIEAPNWVRTTRSIEGFYVKWTDTDIPRIGKHSWRAQDVRFIIAKGALGFVTYGHYGESSVYFPVFKRVVVVGNEDLVLEPKLEG